MAAVGLGKFNIGLVPASVTPPKTWRRAAWFAVLSSAAVLVGLAVAAAELVSSGPDERIALPGYPPEGPLLPVLTTSTPPPAVHLPGIAGRLTGGLAGPAAERFPDQLRDRRHDQTPAAGAEAAGPSDGAPVRGAPVEPPGVAAPTPVAAVRPSGASPVVDGKAIATRTERFYAGVVADADTALALATDDFRAGAGALLRQRFVEVSRVRVADVAVDPAVDPAGTLRITR
ncbi:hypothetical protein [Saccharothrix coeruleofusca]|uniref:hypothetical protein n=1 Tax=Saccharothrix coeruleofusca TaxID=33919 RepID=UPI001671406C|nr:hypothetical protein [Saccharothrix coeruleofusca]